MDINNLLNERVKNLNMSDGEKELYKLNIVSEEIKELEWFIYVAEKVWRANLVNRLKFKPSQSKVMFKTNAYGVFDSKEYELPDHLRYKFITILKEEVQDLKDYLGNKLGE